MLCNSIWKKINLSVGNLSNAIQKLHCQKKGGGEESQMLQCPIRGKKHSYITSLQPNSLLQLQEILFSNVGRYCNHFSKHFLKKAKRINNVRTGASETDALLTE